MENENGLKYVRAERLDKTIEAMVNLENNRVIDPVEHPDGRDIMRIFYHSVNQFYREHGEYPVLVKPSIDDIQEGEYPKLRG